MARSLGSLPLLALLACGGDEPAPEAPPSPSATTTGAATAPVPVPVPAAVAAAPVAAAPNAVDPLFIEVDEVPEALRSGSAAARIQAVARAEGDADATRALAWVMQSDAEPSVREKAWRVLRARWKKGVGVASEHEAAAVWAAGHGAEAVRVEALAALGEQSRDLSAPAAHLADAGPKVRTAAADAVFAIATRTGKRADAKRLLQDRLAIESAGPLRKKLDGWVDQL